MMWLLCIVLIIIGFLSGMILGMHKQRKDDIAEFKYIAKGERSEDNDIKFGGF